MKVRYALAVAAVLALAGCGQSDQPKSAEVKGSVNIPTYALNGAVGAGAAYGCVGDGKFADATPGMNVTVSDSEGKVLAANGALAAGTVSGDGDSCKMDFAVHDVPASDFYQVSIGTHRGAAVPAAEAAAIELTLAN